MISDSDLTEAEFVDKYTSGELSMGDSEEVKNYLRIRHRYYKNQGTWKDVHQAFLQIKGQKPVNN